MALVIDEVRGGCGGGVGDAVVAWLPAADNGLVHRIVGTEEAHLELVWVHAVSVSPRLILRAQWLSEATRQTAED